MPKHCSIYVFHPTYELNQFSFFDITSGKYYFKQLPVSFLRSPLCQSLQAYPEFKVTCYFSGAYLEALKNQEEELKSIRKFIQNGQVEVLLGPYHYSFSSLFSSELFKREIKSHKEMLSSILQVQPKGFLNTMAIFSNDLTELLKKETIEYCIAPRIEWFLGADTATRVFKSKKGKLDILLVGASKNDKELLISYLSGYASNVMNMESVLAEEAVKAFGCQKIYNLPHPAGLGTDGKDLMHFMGNSLQKQVFRLIGELSPQVLKNGDAALQQDFLTLASPGVFDLISQQYSIRYDYYTSIMNCLTDLELKLR